MELQRGTCFLCRNTNVVKTSQSQKIYKMITLLLPKEILNSTEFSKIQSALRICPICYHKLIILKRTNKNVDITNEASSNHCLLCKSEKHLFQINNWPNFSAISEGIACSKNNKCVTCSDCLFYLETRNELKKKLFSKYPQLENKPLNNNKTKRKWKLKLTPKAQSTSLSDRIKRRKFSKKEKNLETISISSDDEDSSVKKNVNFDSLKHLRSLKKDRSFRNNKLVKMDSKFLNQIPYVLVNRSNLLNIHNDISDEDVLTKDTKKEKTENVKIQTENALVKRKNELYKRGIEKHLVVNVFRMKIEKYLAKHEPDPEIQNLIDKFSILKSSNQTTEEVSTNSNSSSSTEVLDRSIEEMETSFEVKNKRKSVSFAEDKNVEIEYFENSNLKPRNKNNLDEDSEVSSKKHSKGILKRDENPEQNTAEKQKESSEKVDENEKINTASEEVQEFKENTEDQNDEASKVNAKNKKNTYLLDENTFSDTSPSDSESENLSKILKKSKSWIEEDTELINRVESDESDIETKKSKLSKMKRRNTIVEDISDDDTNINRSDDIRLTSEDKLEKSGDTEETTKQSETKSVEENGHKTITEDSTESVSKSSADEKLKKSDVKRERPKPLSKKKKSVADNPESVVKETEPVIDLNNSVDGEVTNKSASEDKPVKYKPRPLSKKKKLNDKSEIAESVKEDINSEKSLDTSKDEKPANDINVEEKSASIESNSSTEDNKNSNDLDENVRENQVKVICHSKDETVDEATKPTEENDEDSVLNSESSLIDKESSSNSNSEEKSDPPKDTEVLNEDEVDTSDKDDEKDNSTNVITSNKTLSVSDSEVNQLVNKYLNHEDDSTSTQKDDVSLVNETTNDSTSAHSDEKQTDEGKIDDEKKIESSPPISFSEFEKNDDLGISDVDNDNINSILSNMFTSDLPDDKILLETKDDGNNEGDLGEDTTGSRKRRMSDDELNSSKERKKKKVTFCDDVT